jgi:hypothetical protein
VIHEVRPNSQGPLPRDQLGCLQRGTEVARLSLTIWLDQSMAWYAAPSGKRGLNAVFSEAAIQCCLSLRSLFGLPLRQCSGFVHSLLKLMRLDWPTQGAFAGAITLSYHKGGPLDLPIDSTGVQFLGEGEWKRKAHGAAYRCQWRKVHLGIDAQTLEIRAVEVTDNSVDDAPMLPELIGQIPADEPIASVGADSVYDTWECHQPIAQRGAQTLIPPRINAQFSPSDWLGARVQCGGGGVPAPWA